MNVVDNTIDTATPDAGVYVVGGAGRAGGRHNRRIYRSTRRKLLGWMASTVVLAVAWFCFAPTQMGGYDSFAVTDGISMLPHFHAGDLVVLRKESSYHVGQVAGYHNGQLGVVVMHRIVAIRGDQYVFKGDNNSFVDSFEPTKAQIVGAEWIHLSGVGRYMSDVRRPVFAAVILAVLWILSFRPNPALRRRQRR